MIITSFTFCLLLFVAIGVLSVVKSKNSSSDYLLAGHSIPPWLVALSAVATCNSGYMFIGMVGYSYLYGLSSIWILIGFIVGDFVASLFIHKNLRISSKKNKALSFAGAISSWHGQDYKRLKALAGLITVVFLGVYAAAQLKAGSKALHVLFGWDYSAGAIIGAIIVLLYCFAGGIRASIWTDAAQSFVMIIAMASLLVIGVVENGGIADSRIALSAISAQYLDIIPANLELGKFVGGLLFIAGWLFGGIGIVGQPHIMVRFMAMKSPNQINRVRIYYYSWYSAFSFLTIATAMIARTLISGDQGFDSELILPIFAQEFLPQILIGLVLAGLFAATMSTADSQILSCSAAITNDFYPVKKRSYIATKLATLFVTFVALGIALLGSESVFTLVLISWSVLGASFAPLLFIYILGQRPSERIAIAIMLSGLIAALLWKAFGLDRYIYEIAPGIIAGFIPLLYYKIFQFCHR